MNASEMIARFAGTQGPGTYTVTRTATSTYVDGRVVPGVETTFQIVATIVPSTGRVLESPPEHDRTYETQTLYTATELRTRTPTTEPDWIDIDGEWWVVVRVDRWKGFDTVFYDCDIARDEIT